MCIANDLGKKSYNIGSIRYNFRECFVRLYTTFCVHPSKIPERTENMIVELKSYSKSVFALRELFPVELKKYESIKRKAAELVSYLKRGKENCQGCGSKHRSVVRTQPQAKPKAEEHNETPRTLKVISRLDKVNVGTPARQEVQDVVEDDIVLSKPTFNKQKFIDELTVSDSTAKRRRGRYHLIFTSGNSLRLSHIYLSINLITPLFS